ncbi:hypothetical protein CS8_078690 [Cupriavidus sp. 8B]
MDKGTRGQRSADWEMRGRVRREMRWDWKMAKALAIAIASNRPPGAPCGMPPARPKARRW